MQGWVFYVVGLYVLGLYVVGLYVVGLYVYATPLGAMLPIYHSPVLFYLAFHA